MEHPFRTIVKQFKAAAADGNYPRIILLTGREDFLINWAKGFIRDAVINPAAAELDCSVFSEDNCNPYDVIAACETLPVMSAKKLVICDEFEAFTANSKEDMTALCDYMADVPESSMLVFTSAKPNKTKALYKAAAKYGLVYDFVSLDEETLTGWMNKRLKAAGKSADPRDMIRFAKDAGYWDKDRSYTLYNLENDLKKLFALTDKNVLTREDFLSTAQIQPETQAFRILDAAFRGAKGTALTMLRNSIEQELPSKADGVVFSFIGLLCSQLEIMVEARERQNDGQTLKQIEKETGINGYRLQKCVESSQEKTIGELRKSLMEAYNLEENIKSGLLAPRLAIEMFIASL